MSSDSQPTFVSLVDDHGGLKLVNLSQIAVIHAPKGKDSIQLVMSNGAYIDVLGTEVCDALLRLVSKNAVTPNGDTFSGESPKTDKDHSSSGFQTSPPR
jgi:hypothetical protein